MKKSKRAHMHSRCNFFPKNRKGISPVLGAVLMITLTLALAGLAFMWIRNTAEKVGREQQDVLCRDVDYALGDLRCEGTQLKFNAVNYAPNLKLMGFMITLEAEGETKSFSSNPQEINNLESADVFIEITGDLRNINRVKIIPRVQSEQDIVNCEEQETIRVWSEINGC